MNHYRWVDADVEALRTRVARAEMDLSELRRRSRSHRRATGLTMAVVGLALIIGGLWLGLRSTSFGGTDCGHALASTNRAFHDTPPSVTLEDNDIPVNDCLVWLSANRVSSVALLIPGGLLLLVGAGVFVGTLRRE